jgi:hypothetical protein
MTNKYFLRVFPPPEEFTKNLTSNNLPLFREANAHIHSPHSFSSFTDMAAIFRLAKAENIAVLGINDFFVADGYEDFKNEAVRNSIFPLFNMEFVGLQKQEQKKGIRINDPENPGRIYFSGKGLDFPFNPGFFQGLKLKSVIRENQNQMKAMISLLNKIIIPIDGSLVLSYENIKIRYAHTIVRERHLARAIRSALAENYSDPLEQIGLLERLYGGKKSKAGHGNNALLENEIRSNLLKRGGAAFVEEDEDSFLDLDKIIKIIIKAGGIPCYPVLLDDPSGNYNEFERDKDSLHKYLSSNKIGCIELIPGRNGLASLRSFVKFFHKRDYLILFGTEHNTPEMIPLTVSARGSEKLDDELKQIAWEGVCVIAAHQYLRARGMQGYILPNGTPSKNQKRELAFLGKLVIEFFLANIHSYET